MSENDCTVSMYLVYAAGKNDTAFILSLSFRRYCGRNASSVWAACFFCPPSPTQAQNTKIVQ